jgi:hypothetical protein
MGTLELELGGAGAAFGRNVAARIVAVTPPPYLQQLRNLAWRLVLHGGFSGMGNVPGGVA